ncbi:OLC1v1029763C1 [Oldenlandia corymbosa var. corymbosa]|uniref:OLC1v1029763C1 n=1 Tax=Oldenlandia corymbosa var. corymbosa TaxID=529605 RepID=A0AAV1CF68_OLDCO|nr:OLC1v1029763C1 [Oldenlandia corymbosa var. corymbosa]
MAVRHTDTGKSIKDEITKEICDAKIEVMALDLSSMASVRKFAAEYKATGQPLNILINNAGVWSSKFTLSKDGIELDFAGNHLGHFLLTNLLPDEERVPITVNSLHPGNIATNLMRENRLLMGIGKLFLGLFLKSIQQGATTTCYVALHPQVKGISGEYFADCNLSIASDLALNIELAQEVVEFQPQLDYSQILEWRESCASVNCFGFNGIPRME